HSHGTSRAVHRSACAGRGDSAPGRTVRSAPPVPNSPRLTLAQRRRMGRISVSPAPPDTSLAAIYLALIFHVTSSPSVLYAPLSATGGFPCRIRMFVLALVSRFFFLLCSPLFAFLPLHNLLAAPATISSRK